MSDNRVLVTGASGFIAKYCIAELIKAGFSVRGTVRSLARRDEIEAALISLGAASGSIDLVEADLNADQGWRAAAADCDYILHVASPFPATEPSNPDTLIKPARDGALRVLRAAAASGVKRVVQTSSVVAIMQCGKPDHEPRTEADWTDTTNSRVSSYARSKTLAERAAWSALQQLDAASRPEYCVINPGLVFGPAIDRDLSSSHQLIRHLGRGVFPAIPKVAYPIADVRDVAHHHLVAMTHPAAAGSRWLSCNGTLSLHRVGQLMVEALPDLKSKVPMIELPSILVQLASRFDRRLRAVRADLGRANLCDNRKSVIELGMQFRSPDEAIQAAAQSLRGLGII